jgi:hypothetical protein
VLEWIGPTVAAIKNAGPPIYAAVFVSAALLLFLPGAIVTQLGLTDFRESYRTYAGVALLASASLLVVQAILAIIPVILAPWQKWRWRRDMLEPNSGNWTRARKSSISLSENWPVLAPTTRSSGAARIVLHLLGRAGRRRRFSTAIKAANPKMRMPSSDADPGGPSRLCERMPMLTLNREPAATRESRLREVCSWTRPTRNSCSRGALRS